MFGGAVICIEGEKRVGLPQKWVEQLDSWASHTVAILSQLGYIWRLHNRIKHKDESWVKDIVSPGLASETT